MSIRFPKKNIAQSQFDRKSKSIRHDIIKSVPIPVIPTLPAVVDSKSENVPQLNYNYSNPLYPDKLYQLHSDIELFFYKQDKLSPKNRQELTERMPHSLEHAEKEADKLLFKFVQSKINEIGAEAYSKLLNLAVDDETRILFALRCMIAASSDERVAQRIQVFRNEKMESADFFPNECKRSMLNPETGLDMVYYVDRPDSKNKEVYWRSLNHRGKQELIREILGPKLTKRDRMPANLFEEMRFVLEDFGIKVNSNDEAWRVLNERSKGASINNRILARIMYLIANASVNKKIYKLSNKGG